MCLNSLPALDCMLSGLPLPDDIFDENTSVQPERLIRHLNLTWVQQILWPASLTNKHEQDSCRN